MQDQRFHISHHQRATGKDGQGEQQVRQNILIIVLHVEEYCLSFVSIELHQADRQF